MVRSINSQPSRQLFSYPFLLSRGPKVEPIPKIIVITKMFTPKFCAEPRSNVPNGGRATCLVAKQLCDLRFFGVLGPVGPAVPSNLAPRPPEFTLPPYHGTHKIVISAWGGPTAALGQWTQESSYEYEHGQKTA